MCKQNALWVDSCFSYLSYLQIIKIDTGNQDVMEQRKVTTSLPTPFYFIYQLNLLLYFPSSQEGCQRCKTSHGMLNFKFADGVVIFYSIASSTTSASVSYLNRIHSSLVRRRNVLNPVLKTYKPSIPFPLLAGGVSAMQNQPRNANINFADGVVVFYSIVSSTTSHPEYSGRTPPDRRRNVLNLVLKTYKSSILFPLLTGGVSATQNKPRNAKLQIR